MTRWFETNHFYDRAARRLRIYSRERLHELHAAVEEPNPEDVFTSLVRDRLKPDDRALDIGTGDAKWLLENVALHVSWAIGLDYAGIRLRDGLLSKTRAQAGNLQLMLADARRIPLGNEAVSVLLNRRGPFGDPADQRFFSEGCRVLCTGGRVFEIGIGELNAREVSRVFGRGQMMEEERRGPVIGRRVAGYRDHGLEPDHVEDLVSFEYFPNREAPELRLLTSPILDDFDPQAEANLVDEIVRSNSTERGIRLTFHRTILAATKTRP